MTGKQSDQRDQRFRISAVITAYHPRSHADVIVGRWFEQYEHDSAFGWDGPNSDIVSMYVQQFPEDDIARQLSNEQGVPIYDSIEGALTCGGDDLAVDAVLLIAEHGKYPYNSLGQEMYPRRAFFDAIVKVFDRTGKTVPVYCDKFFSWNFIWASEMVEIAAQKGFMLFGGSSLPCSRQVPVIDVPDETHFNEVVFVYHHSPERYGYHSFEFAQSFVEKRKGGESGVESMTVYTDDCWDQLDAGIWSSELMHAAINIQRKVKPGDYRENCMGQTESPMVTVVKYVDGLKVTHVNLTGHVWNFSAAMRINGCDEIFATEPCLKHPDIFTPNFATLCRMIEDAAMTRKPPHPIERSLLTTGMTAAHMKALSKPGVEIKTPELWIGYQPSRNDCYNVNAAEHEFPFLDQTEVRD